MSLAPLPGSPEVLHRVGRDYERTAADIRAAVAELGRIASPDAMVSVALDAVRSDAARIADEIARAEGRYQQAGEALVDYARELGQAQDDARAAIAAYEAADAEAARRSHAHDEAARELRTLTADTSASAEQLAVSARSLARLDAAADAAASDRAAALRRYHDAVEARDRAAEHARARIHDIVEGSDLNDSFWDDVAGFLGDVVELAGTVLKAIVDAVVAVITAVVVAVVAIVVLLAAVIVLGLALVVLLVAAAIAIAVVALVLALAVVLAFLAIAIAAGLVVLAAAVLIGLIGLVIAKLATMLPIAAAFTLAGLIMGKDPYDALLGGIIASLIVTTPALLAVIAAAAAADRGEPSFDGETDVMNVTPADQSFSDLFDELGRIDEAGHDPGAPESENARSVVQITTFTSASGETIYRISIPSTQQWTPGGTSGNDVTSDIVAKMDPFQRTQLEDMVTRAMAEAGVPDGAHVMLAGWSLGGITAGNLAADPAFARTYKVDAVVAAGSSLDDIPIPPSTKVLDISHTTDPVPHTENPFLPDHRGDGNRYKLNEWPPGGPAGDLGHNSDKYATTVDTYVDDATEGAGHDFRTAPGSGDGVRISDYFGRPTSAEQYGFTRG